MKVLFLNPPFKTEYGKYSRTSRTPAITKSGTVYYPIWLCYAAAAVEQGGHEINVIDSCANQYNFETTLNMVNEFNPDIVIEDTSTASIHEDVRMALEIKKILPNIKISGFDISKYGIKNSKKEIKEFLFVHKAQDKFPFKKNEFDLVFSIHCLHNLQIHDLKNAVQEIQRVGKFGYIALEGYRNEKELFGLQCWALTAESFFSDKEWIWIYNQFGYKGDYEFIYFN